VLARAYVRACFRRFHNNPHYFRFSLTTVYDQKDGLLFGCDLELYLQVVLHLYSASGGADRLNPELGLLDLCAS
jgi:hypothetical protein